jgi:hypothetical protein
MGISEDDLKEMKHALNFISQVEKPPFCNYVSNYISTKKCH